jgi:hypothetical protein
MAAQFADWGALDLPYDIATACLESPECDGYIYVDKRPLQPDQVPPPSDRVSVFISEMVRDFVSCQHLL